MMPLAPNEVAALQRALPLVRRDASAAEQCVRRLSANARRHPDAQFVLAQALRGQGRFAEALTALEAALALAPRNPQLHNAHGNCLADLGEADPALAAFNRATAIEPRFAEGFINAGIVATRFGRFEAAAAALARARALRPSDTRMLNALGGLAEAQGDAAAAATAYAEALAIDPGDAACRHNLAGALRRLDRAADALAVLDAMPAAAPIESATLRGHLLAELGAFDAAVDAYHAVVSRAPEHLDAQQSLARLLPQIGRGDEALEAFAATLRGPASLPLWGAAIAAASALGASETQLAWIAGAEAAHGPHLELTLARSAALSMSGDVPAALALARSLAVTAPDVPAVHTNLARLLLQARDPAAAAHHAESATRLAPREQTGWALLATAWRLTGDPRHGWLADHDALVVPIDLDVPPGWPDRAGFVADVAAALERRHLTRAHPADQSLRGGTQTGGNLFDRADPVLQALKASVEATVARALAQLPADPAHPFLGRNTGRIAFAGSWSVRLRSSGFHIDHIHPQGWLSSALHIAVPSETDGGALRFGVPDARLGLDLAPLRTILPVPGRLVLFPSYFWHGTVPFDSAQPRLSVAFDALPG